MNILVLDTETIDTQKRFCYNLGYCIVNLDTGEILKKNDFVISQFWENKPLFETAYYANKKEVYVKLLRSRQAELTKWGYACTKMICDIQHFEVKNAFAFNAPFDISVLDFNSDWFKNRNPLDYVETFDIMNVIQPIVTSEEYIKFCVDNNLLTEGNNCSTNAEDITRFLSKTIDFSEDHTALSDSLIEAQILLTLKNTYKVDIFSKLPRKLIPSGKSLIMNIDYKGTPFTFEYTSKRKDNINNIIHLK